MGTVKKVKNFIFNSNFSFYLKQDQGRKWSAWYKVFGWNDFLVENILESKKNFGQKYLRVENIF